MVLHGHSRAITDINFHSETPNILATSSIDSYIHCWDFRESSRKPMQSFADFFSGANQVKWSRNDPHILASSHDKRVMVWDDRMSKTPVHTIQAHRLKVNGLDFSRTSPNLLLSCSNDMTIKCWDISTSSCDEGVAQFTIETNFPVGRSRHTPFGTGCVIMPLRGGSNNVYLVDIDQKKIPSGATIPLNPVHEFSAHTEPVREFLWRSKGGQNPLSEDRDFQFVTWAKDNEVRLWPVDRPILEEVNYQYGAPIAMKLTRRGAKYRTYHTEPTEFDKDLDGSNKHREAKISAGSYGSPVTNNYMFKTQKPNSYTPAIMTTGIGLSANIFDPRKDHLNWISGVKIIKPGSASSEQSNIMSNSITSANSTFPDSSFTPENLAEEVSFVGAKFPRVTFEKISVSRGELVISLQRAESSSSDDFDSSNDLIFLRVEVNIPHDYPASPPVFSIQANKLSPDAIESLELELAALAKQLTDHKKYCLEPCLRCLLGEKVSIRDLIRDVLDDPKDLDIDKYDENQSDLDNDAFPDAFPYGSDNDDGDSSMSEFNTGYTELKNQNQMSKLYQGFDPLNNTRTCGAVWSISGLVSFFNHDSQKKNKRPNTQDSMHSHHSDKLISKLDNAQLAKYYPDDSSIFEDDQEVYLYYSSDSDSFDDEDKKLEYIRRYRRGTNYLHHTLDYAQDGSESYGWPSRLKNRVLKRDFAPLSTAGRSQGTYPQHHSSSEVSRDKNYVLIKDCSDILPAQFKLASRYQVMGASPKILSQRNGQAAYEEGFIDIANCWKLIELILTTEFTVGTCLDQIVSQMNPSDNQGIVQHLAIKSFEWGNHPFGRDWLIPQLFDYFEKKQDPQMLAVMSCIFASTDQQSNRSRTIPDFEHAFLNSKQNAGHYKDENSKFYEQVKLNHFSEISLPSSRTQSFSFNHIRSNSTTRLNGWDMLQHQSKPLSYQNQPMLLQENSSPFIEDDASLSSATPERYNPVRRTPGGIFSRSGSATNVNTSPGISALVNSESYFPRFIEIGDTSNNYATINSNNSSFKSTDTPSPPKRAPHDMSYIGLSNMFANTPASRVPSRGSFNSIHNSHGIIDIPLAPTPPVSKPPNALTSQLPKMSFKVLNQDLFDDSACALHVPFLDDKSRELKYKQYRHSYAQLLFFWKLEEQSAEVLKFNYMNIGTINGKASIIPQDLNSYSLQRAQSRHVRTASRHNNNNNTNESGGLYSLFRAYISFNTEGPADQIKKRMCQHCRLPITDHDRCFFCISCAHILHVHCAESWFVDEGVTECTTGCGCKCMDALESPPPTEPDSSDFIRYRPKSKSKLNAKVAYAYI